MGMGLELEQLHGQMVRRAIAAGGIGELARLFAKQFDDLGGVIGADARIDHQCQRSVGQQSDRREIGDQVVGQFFVQTDIDRMRIAHHQQGVTIGCRLLHCLDADIAASADAVLDDDLLLPEVGEFF